MDNLANMSLNEIYNICNREPEHLINENGASVIIYRNWLSPETAKILYDVAFENCNIQHEIMLYGKKLIQPRFNVVYGENYVGKYKYSGALLDVYEWLPEIRKLRDTIQNFTGFHADSCLINGYANGLHNVGYHSDKEIMDPNKTVVTLSTGATRKFYYQRIGDTTETIKTVLNEGDLLIMTGKTNDLFKHCVPKESKVKDARYSYTFRQIVR